MSDDLARKAAQFRALSPVVQRFEIDSRCARLDEALRILRVEFQRCKMQSAGIAADLDPIMQAGQTVAGHIAHLKTFRPE